MKQLFLVAVFSALAMTLVACSGASTTASRIAPDAYVAQFDTVGSDHILIDVRTPSEFNSGHIAGAINIPVDQIANRLNEIPSDVPVVVYCRSGSRSAQATNILSRNDYSEIYDLGGIIGWQSAGYPIQ